MLRIGILLCVVDMFLVPEEIGKARAGAGLQPEVSALLGLWFLLPLVDWIVSVVKAQGATNPRWAA